MSPYNRAPSHSAREQYPPRQHSPPASRRWAPEDAWQPGMHEGYSEAGQQGEGYHEEPGRPESEWHQEHGQGRAREPAPSRPGHPVQAWYDLDEVASKPDAKTAAVAADMYDL